MHTDSTLTENTRFLRGRWLSSSVMTALLIVGSVSVGIWVYSSITMSHRSIEPSSTAQLNGDTLLTRIAGLATSHQIKNRQAVADQLGAKLDWNGYVWIISGDGFSSSASRYRGDDGLFYAKSTYRRLELSLSGPCFSYSNAVNAFGSEGIAVSGHDRAFNIHGNSNQGYYRLPKRTNESSETTFTINSLGCLSSIAISE